MSSIHFFTPVSYGPFACSVSKKFLEIADDLFSWSGKKVQVIPGNKIRNSAVVTDYFENPSLLRNVIKVVAYCTLLIPMSAVYTKKTPLLIGGSCALALPLIAFVVKLVLRTIYKFHYIESSPVKFVGESDLSPRITDSQDFHELFKDGLLKFDTIYRISFDAVAKLRIIPLEDKPINHNLPQRSNDVYAIPPRICRCFSEVSIFNNSIFEVNYKARYDKSTNTMIDNYYEVVRRKFIVKREELMTFNETHQLSTDEIIDLKIVPVSSSSGYSIRAQYRDSVFEFPDNSAMGGNVKRLLFERDYAYLPFNEAVPIEPKDHERLQLIKRSESYNLEPDVRWTVCTSKLPEYANSIILISYKAGCPGGSFVRMLKP